MTELDIEIFGTGRPLVLLHSLLTDRSSFAALAERLAGSRRLYLVNLPGFGTSPPALPLEGYADAVVKAMDDLDLPAETDVLGNGLGGFVGLTMAARYPGRFQRLALLGSALAFPEAGRATFRAMADKAETEGIAALTEAAMQRMFPPDYIAASKEIVDGRRTVFERIDASVFAAACRALAEMDLAPFVAGIANPVLIATGEMDTATLPALGRALAAALPDARYVELAGLGHAPHIQAPDTLLAAVGPFLELDGAG